LSATQAVVLISQQCRDHGTRTQMDSILLLSFSHDLANGAAEHASQRGRAAFNNGDIQAKITADRGNFTADKAAASDQYMPGPARQAGRYLAGMIAIAQNEEAIECALLGIGPRAGARSGGNQQVIKVNSTSIGEQHPPLCQI